MSLVLVVEPDSSQADILRKALRKRSDIELVLVKSTDAALQALGESVPDLMLLSALLSPRDEAALMAHLRSLGEAASHLQTLTIPRLGSGHDSPAESRGGLNPFRKKKSPSLAAGADPAAFAEEIVSHAAHAVEARLRVREAAAARALEPQVPLPEPAPVPEPAVVEETPSWPEFAQHRVSVQEVQHPVAAAPGNDDLLTGALTELISLEAAARHAETTSSPVPQEWPSAQSPVAVFSEPVPAFSAPVAAFSEAVSAFSEPVAPEFDPQPGDGYTPLNRPIAFTSEPLEDLQSAFAAQPVATQQPAPPISPVAASDSVFDLPVVEEPVFEPINLTDSIFDGSADVAEEEPIFSLADNDEDSRPSALSAAAVFGSVDDEVERLAGELGFDTSTLKIETIESPAAVATSEAQVERDLLDEMAAIQAEAEAKLAEELGRVRAEAEERRVAELARLQAEADHQRETAINEARIAAENEAREALAAELARARAEAEGTLTDVMNRVKQEAEQARLEAEQARLEAERRVVDAEQRIGAEVGRAREDADTLRANLERVQQEALEARSKIDQLTELKQQAESAFVSELSRVRSEAEETLNAQLNAARAEAERLREEPARVKAEAERLRLAAAEDARRSAEEKAARALDAEVARVREEAEAHLRHELDRIRKEAEQARLADQSQAKQASQQLTQQLREAAAREARAIAEAAAQRTLESEIARVRQDADSVLESELTKARADAERRQRTELQDLRAMMAEMREAAAHQARTAAAEAVAAEVAKISPGHSDSISFSDEQDQDRISVFTWWKARRQAKRAVTDIQNALRGREGADRLAFLRNKWALPVAAGILLVVANQGSAINAISQFISPARKEPAVIAVAEAAKAPPPVIEKKGGDLKVETTPAGAEVSIGGKRYGKTPVTIPDLKEGVYTMTLQSPAGTVSRKVTIRNGKTTIASEAIFAGWLAIFSPIPLDIVLNGKGATPSDDGRFMVAPGRYEVEMVNQRFNFRAHETFEVRPGQVTAHTLQLPSGIVRLSAPEGAEIRVDGEPVGKMPLPHLSVSLGTHQISAVHPEMGERHATVDVKQGESTDVALTFTP